MLASLLPSLCAGWIIGVGVGSAFSPLSAGILGALGTAGLLSAMSSARPVRVAGLTFLALFVGAARADLAVRRDVENFRTWRDIAGPVVTMTGRVVSQEMRNTLSVIRVGDVRRAESPSVALPGLLQVRVRGGSAVREGARVRLFGRVANPERSSSQGSFDPERYFSRHGVFAVMERPKLRVIEEGRAPALTTLREHFRATIRAAVPEPAASVYTALLLSHDEDLSPVLRDAFAASGLAHLIAISGSHIALLAAATFLVLTSLGLSRTTAVGGTLLLSSVFLLLVGLPASGVRALLMAGIMFWSYAAGRRFQGLRALLVAIVLMTLLNPRLLLGDLGFQLSALAMWGLFVLYPLLALPFRARRDFFGVRTVVLLTLAAELATAPLIAYAFGRVSVIGVVTNIIAVPMFPVLLGSAALMATIGTLPYVQPLLSPLASGAASLFVWLGDTAAHVPGATVHTPPFPGAALAVAYGLLILGPLLWSAPVRVWAVDRRRLLCVFLSRGRDVSNPSQKWL